MNDPNFTFLYWLPAWFLGAVFLLVLLLAAEGGYRRGARNRPQQEALAAPPVNLILTAVLALLGLMLAFTYSFVATRSDNRKQAIVIEANALGTAYLRAGLLAEPARSQLRSLLRDYTDTRVLADSAARSRAQVEAALAESERLQNRLWPAAAQALQGRSPTLIDSLLLQSLNDVIDAHTTRLAAARDRLPDIILLMLGFLAAVALWLTGYALGLAGPRHIVLTTTFIVLLTVVTLVIADLDRPRSGLVYVSQQSLLDARRSMVDEASPSPPPTAPNPP